MNEPYEHDPRVAEIDAELEQIDAERIALKERGRELMNEKREIAIRENVTLRVLSDSPLSQAETQWVAEHPDEWKAIKTDNKRGSRKGLRVAVK